VVVVDGEHLGFNVPVELARSIEAVTS
jgi:hypothetical protein